MKTKFVCKLKHMYLFDVSLYIFVHCQVFKSALQFISSLCTSAELHHEHFQTCNWWAYNACKLAAHQLRFLVMFASLRFIPNSKQRYIKQIQQNCQAVQKEKIYRSKTNMMV